jgi:hypothetical protein
LGSEETNVAVSSTTFDARIARITGGKTTIWTDPETGIRMQRKESHAARMARIQTGPKAFMYRLVAVVMAGVLGAVAGALGPLVRLHAASYTGWQPEGDILLGANFGAAIVLSFFLVSFLSFRGKLIRLSQFAGVIGMTVFLHNLVWWYPEPFTTVASAEWVSQTKAVAQPGTLAFRGYIYVW